MTNLIDFLIITLISTVLYLYNPEGTKNILFFKSKTYYWPLKTIHIIIGVWVWTHLLLGVYYLYLFIQSLW